MYIFTINFTHECVNVCMYVCEHIFLPSKIHTSNLSEYSLMLKLKFKFISKSMSFSPVSSISSSYPASTTSSDDDLVSNDRKCANKLLELVRLTSSPTFNINHHLDNLDVIDYCINCGFIHINEYLKSGHTLLTYAATYNDFNFVKALLMRYHPNPNVRTNDMFGRTALMCACVGGRLDVVKLLFTYGADVNISNYLGRTPLMEACLNDDFAMFKYLLSCRAFVDIFDTNRNTVLMYVCDLGRDVEYAKELFFHGAVIDRCNEGGISALKLAVQHQNDSTVQFLTSIDRNEHDLYDALVVAKRTPYTAYTSLLARRLLELEAERREEGKKKH